MNFLWENYNKNLVRCRRQERNWVRKITSLLHRFWIQFDDAFLSQWIALCLTHGDQRGHQIPCNCIYRWLWADIWVLGTKWRPFVKASSFPDCRAIFPVPVTGILKSSPYKHKCENSHRVLTKIIDYLTVRDTNITSAKMSNVMLQLYN